MANNAIPEGELGLFSGSGIHAQKMCILHACKHIHRVTNIIYKIYQIYENIYSTRLSMPRI